MNVVRLDHVAIPASNLEIAKRFYGDILGLALLPSPKGTQWFKCGENFIHVLDTSESDLAKSGMWSRRHIAIDVSDLLKCAEELRANDVKIERGPLKEKGLFRLFCFDFDGNRIEIREFLSS
ncbi:MAG: hypothetical protein CMO12_04600 [Thaumarchaeota archaeon]|jgi:catechol 2,3-dioxygenase-like lactoylglutathione lyase family enzyme|nr:hypothetical protein [Nitrososphaerota archaeon]|tara:strand:- start:769 stop:1134 length:366 start_codon:yes stop_codon:yes gene_type:complete